MLLNNYLPLMLSCLLCAGTAAAYVGIALFSALTEKPLAYFLGPALAVSGLLLLLGLGLEARKWKVNSHMHVTPLAHFSGPHHPIH